MRTDRGLNNSLNIEEETKNMDQREIALAAAKTLDDKRGKYIVALKVDEMTVITDYMVIASGRSVPQVKALAEQVEEELAKLAEEKGLQIRIPRSEIFDAMHRI